MADATWPAWDASGKYLYFLASTDFGLRTGWLDMTSYDRPVTRALYAGRAAARTSRRRCRRRATKTAACWRRRRSARLVRRRRGTAGAAPRRPGCTPHAPTVDHRLRRPRQPHRLARRGAARLRAAAGAGRPARSSSSRTCRRAAPRRAARAAATAAPLPAQGAQGRRPSPQGVTRVRVSHDGKKLLWRAGRQRWPSSTPTRRAPTGNGRARDAPTLRMLVDPRAEYRQMFAEGWRNQREFLYVSNMHGADYVKTKAMYEPLLAARGASRRLQLPARHDWAPRSRSGTRTCAAATIPTCPRANVGLLGADLARGRTAATASPRIYTGESWNPELRAPLLRPGHRRAKAGDYLLAVDGVELRAPDNLYRAARGHGEPADRAHGQRHARPLDGARRVTVVPVASERRTAHPRLGRGQPAPGRLALAAAGSPTSTCPTPASPATPRSTATTSRSRTARAS